MKKKDTHGQVNKAFISLSKQSHEPQCMQLGLGLPPKPPNHPGSKTKKPTFQFQSNISNLTRIANRKRRILNNPPLPFLPFNTRTILPCKRIHPIHARRHGICIRRYILAIID